MASTASAASWLKGTFLDLFTEPELSDSLDTTPSKRKASQDGGGRANSKRLSDDAYRNAPYGSPSPSYPQGRFFRPRDSVKTIRARRSLQDLKRHLSCELNPLVSGALERLEGHLGVESRPVGKLTPAGKPQSFEDLEFPDEGASEGVSEGASEGIKEWRPIDYVQPAVENLQRLPTSTNEAPWEQGMNSDDMWAARPNKRARDHLSMRPMRARQFIQADVKEPEYALRDVEVRDGLWHMMDLMERFTKKFFSGSVGHDRQDSCLQDCFEELSPETAKIIGCVASGGPQGERGWKELFLSNPKKRALVMAIIGNVLVEQVFQHIFFGGIVKHIRELTGLQKEHKNADGFDRNMHYATVVRNVLDLDHNDTFNLPSNFTNHVNYITGAIWTHLRPIFKLDERIHGLTDHDILLNNDPITPIAEIVAQAGLLSLSVRMDPHTVYYFEPVFKEDTFTSKRMECFNRQEMQQSNPRTPDDDPLLTQSEHRRRCREEMSEAEKKRARYDEPLTQITILDGVTAYRLGGWEDATSTVQDPVFEKPEYVDMGVRSRILTHGWVFCRWGRTRRFKDGVAADVPEVHGEAWDGGFKEFADCEGVVDWLGVERSERARARGETVESGKGKERAVTVETGVEDNKSVDVSSLPRVMRGGGPGFAGPSGSARAEEADLQAQLLEDTESEEFDVSDDCVA